MTVFRRKFARINPWRCRVKKLKRRSEGAGPNRAAPVWRPASKSPADSGSIDPGIHIMLARAELTGLRQF